MKEDEYMVLESKLTHSEEEIELLAKGTASVLIKKLKNMAKNPNKDVRATFEQVAGVLLCHEKKVAQSQFKPRGVSFNRSYGNWRAEKYVNGKRTHIATSKDKDIVIQALKHFCETHNIPM